jgi:hypothetical protein
MEKLVKNGYCFWTILLLTPSSMASIMGGQYYSPSFLLNMIESALRRAADPWAAIGTHFSSILDDQTAILHPIDHDKLLFDDETFSRSRRYFWAVDSLETFRTRIMDTIQEWDYFWEARGEGIRKLEVAQRLRLEYMIKNGNASYYQKRDGSVEKSLKRVHGQITRLKDQNAQFETFYKKTLALREGVRHLNVPEGHWSKTLIANSYLTQVA